MKDLKLTQNFGIGSLSLLIQPIQQYIKRLASIKSLRMFEKS